MKRHASLSHFFPIRPGALMAGILALTLMNAPRPAVGQTSPADNTDAPAAQSSDPTSILAEAFGDQFVYIAGKIDSSQTDSSTGPVRWTFRNGFRLYSDTINIKCDTLVYETQDGKARFRATPAVGQRVEVVQSGMRAACGLLEFYPDEKLTILRRRPVIYQKNASGREFETSGHVITMTQNEENQLRVKIDSKRGDVEELGSQEPAILIVDNQTKPPPAQGLSIEEMRRRMESGGRVNLSSREDMQVIPIQERREADYRR